MTKKELQKHENFLVLDTMVLAVGEFYDSVREDITLKRLRSCTAWVYETKNYYILKSYNTFIGCIDKATGVTYDSLRYSYGYTSTSAQHISKFTHDYGNGKRYTFRNI